MDRCRRRTCAPALRTGHLFPQRPGPRLPSCCLASSSPPTGALRHACVARVQRAERNGGFGALRCKTLLPSAMPFPMGAFPRHATLSSSRELIHQARLDQDGVGSKTQYDARALGLMHQSTPCFGWTPACVCAALGESRDGCRLKFLLFFFWAQQALFLRGREMGHLENVRLRS